MQTLGNGVIVRKNQAIVHNQVSLSDWDYATTDAAAAVEAANFFDPLAARLKKGDMITARLALGGTPVLKNYIVTSNDGSTVVVAKQNVA